MPSNYTYNEDNELPNSTVKLSELQEYLIRNIFGILSFLEALSIEYFFKFPIKVAPLNGDQFELDISANGNQIKTLHQLFNEQIVPTNPKYANLAFEFVLDIEPLTNDITPRKLVYKIFDIEEEFLLINFLDEGPLEEHMQPLDLGAGAGAGGVAPSQPLDLGAGGAATATPQTLDLGAGAGATAPPQPELANSKRKSNKKKSFKKEKAKKEKEKAKKEKNETSKQQYRKKSKKRTKSSKRNKNKSNKSTK